MLSQPRNLALKRISQRLQLGQEARIYSPRGAMCTFFLLIDPPLLYMQRLVGCY